jgi:hypothetical protein
VRCASGGTLKVSAGLNRSAQSQHRNPTGREPTSSGRGPTYPGTLPRNCSWLTFQVMLALSFFVMRWLAIAL